MCLKNKNFTQAHQHINLAYQTLNQSPLFALDFLVKAAKLHYPSTAIALTNLIESNSLSPEKINYFFTSIKETLNLHRYQDIDHQTIQITNLTRLIDLDNPEYPPISEDAHLLINLVVQLLENLQIDYHNIQHTLEVVLGTTQAMLQYSKEDQIKDPKKILLPIVAALFHDIGYSNAKEIISFIQNLSSSD